MFNPNRTAQLYARQGYDSYSRPTFSTDPISIGIAIVRLVTLIEKTSVRADASATRGGADHETLKSIILVEKGSGIKMDDKVVINDENYQVMSVHPRYSVAGVHDHDEISLDPSP